VVNLFGSPKKIEGAAMATYVLVPGGWHGGWYFEPLARRLRTGGHEAYPVTLTGVGDRNHLLTASVNLDTHIQDVVAVLESERIEDAVLVAHSYGGMVISGVADRVPERVDSVVYCDAYVPEDGDSCFTLTSDTYRSQFLEGCARDGYAVEPPERLRPRATSHPLASFLQSIRLTGSLDRFRRRDYIYLSGWPATPFTALYKRLSEDPAWHVHDIPVGHNVMAAAADDLASILLDVA
jgi:pimeloyl-ACP methyl ester carboxylesterase